MKNGNASEPGIVRHEGRDYLWLGCGVECIDYDFATHSGRAFLCPGHCTDYTSVVRYFKRIDPKVQRIETFSGDVPDTVYEMTGDTFTAYMRR